MSRKTKRAAALAVAASLVSTLALADYSGAHAEDEVITSTQVSPAEVDLATPKFVAEPVVQQIPDEETEDFSQADSLRELVSLQPAADLSEDLKCLADAVYFEARGEPLSGQLAVARVIINRAESAKFPDTYCDVVTQRSQFSFVHNGRIPKAKTSSRAWKDARAIAQIAHEGLWDSPAKGALYFHATRVRPNWRLQHVATVDSHAFYR